MEANQFDIEKYNKAKERVKELKELKISVFYNFRVTMLHFLLFLKQSLLWLRRNKSSAIV